MFTAEVLPDSDSLNNANKTDVREGQRSFMKHNTDMNHKYNAPFHAPAPRSPI